MSTATAEPTTKTTFIARSADQVLTRKGVRYVQDGEGGKRALDEAEWIGRQEDLNHERLGKGEEPIEIDRTPWKVVFRNHRFETDDERLIAWLRAHPRFNMPGPSGFYEQGKAPDEPRPTITEQMTEIADAGAAGDLDRLEAALNLEKETHNRESVLVSAEAGIARLREFDAKLAPGADTEGDSGEPGAADDPPQ